MSPRPRTRSRSWRTTCNATRAQSFAAATSARISDDLDQIAAENLRGWRDCDGAGGMLRHLQNDSRPAEGYLEVLSPHAHRRHRRVGADHGRRFRDRTWADQTGSVPRSPGNSYAGRAQSSRAVKGRAMG